MIRGRVVQRGVPEQAMSAVESSVPVAQKIKSEGIGGVWEQLKEKVGDLKENLLGKIAEYLIPTVIVAGITWIISLLNPASAFIKACKAIIDIVTFIIDRGAQIIAFVNAVLDAVIAIAGGGAGGVPGLIETALATAIPVLIGFLAALLGIGGLAEKVKKLFQSLSKPVMKAVDWIVGKIAAFGKKLWAKLKAKVRGGDDSPAGKQKRLDKGLAAGVAAVNKYRDRPVAGKVLTPLLAAVRVRYGLAELRPVQSGDHWSVYGRVNPEGTKETAVKTEAEVTGMVAAYRGIHFKLTWSQQDYDRNLRQNLVGKPTFSAAARELAGSRTPDGSDVPEADLHAAAELVQEQVKKTKEPSSVRQWWGAKKQQFDSLFLAMLQRYVNTYDAFDRELKNPPYSSSLGFTSIPFISTSKHAAHAARYAKGEKFISDTEKRKSGIVGRVFVYLFSLRDLKQQDPANVQQLAGGKGIKVKARIIHEGEIAFTGGIPGDNLVAQHDASAAQSAEDVASTAEQTAKARAGSQGGLKEW